MAERRVRQPRPGEAGRVGCVRRYGPADDARRASAVPRRDRLAGRHARRRGAHRRRERSRHDREPSGEGVRRRRAPSDVRPGHRAGEHLRIPRRRGPRRVPGGPLPSSTARRVPRRASFRTRSQSSRPAPSPRGSRCEPSWAPCVPESRWRRGGSRSSSRPPREPRRAHASSRGATRSPRRAACSPRAEPSAGSARRVSYRRIGSRRCASRGEGCAHPCRPPRRRDELVPRDDHRASRPLSNLGCAARQPN